MTFQMKRSDRVFTREKVQRNMSKDEKLYYVSDTYATLEHRTIFLTADIDEEAYSKFVAAFRYLEETDGPINIILCTPGGDVSYMFSMYDMIRASKKEITVIGTGEVCSAGVLLLACGHKRIVTENCVLMSHAGSADMEGDYETIKARMKWLDWTQERWAVLMARHTPQDTSWWKRWTKKEAEIWFLGGDEIVAKGLADAVLEEGFVNGVVSTDNPA